MARLHGCEIVNTQIKRLIADGFVDLLPYLSNLPAALDDLLLLGNDALEIQLVIASHIFPQFILWKMKILRASLFNG